MSIDFIGVIVYIAILRFNINYNLSIKFSAVTVGIVPFILKTAYIVITMPTYDNSIARAITPSSIVIAIGQLISSFVIFCLLQQNEERTANWFMIAIFGAFISYTLITYVIPYFVAY